ncbi:MAG: PhzF family phenazine biosynthesis protein [Burkholderiales bacterium]
MKLPLYQVDAFTNRVFGGNPAAVVLLEDWLPDRVLAAIAAENNLAETAFVVTRGEAMPLRWFTPTVEVDLCGHATLAAAHVLFRHRLPAAERVAFSTRSGELAVSREGGLLSMDFPALPGKSTPVTQAIVAVLGVRPREAYLARDLLVILESESQVRSFRPDFHRLAAFDAFGVAISAPGESADYVYRFFAPRQGIPEDPATGSASCTLVPYWAARLGKTELIAKQLSARGGELHCALRGERVLIAGHAVEYLRGEIEVDA